MDRERHLMDHLRKIYGPSFSADVEQTDSGLPIPNTRVNPFSLSPASPSSMPIISSPLSKQQARHGNGMEMEILLSPSTETPGLDKSREAGEEKRQLQRDKPLLSSTATASETQNMMKQLAAVQNLVQRFERRLLMRESELIKMENEAGENSKKVREMLRI